MGKKYMKIYLKTEYGFIKMPYGIKSLQKGDEFKMIDPNTKEVYVGFNNRTVFKCIGDPYWSNKYEEWVIDVE